MKSAGPAPHPKLALILQPSRLFGLLMLALIVASIVYSFRSPFAKALRRQEPVFGILLGTDWVDNARHSDTLVVMRYNPVDRSLDLLSIPRDTKLDSPKYRVHRINEVFTYVFKTSKSYETASREVAETVRGLLFAGRPDAPEIPYYAQIDYDGFKKIVDLLGGVPVNVYEPMHYDDNWGKLHIHFEPGQYLLSGQKALEYVRYRNTQGDYGRVLRQQEFLLNALSRFRKPSNILRLPQIIATSFSAIKTNLSGFDRLLVLWELKGVTRDRIRLIQLPGKSSRNYWVPESDAIAATADLLTTGAGKKATSYIEYQPAPEASALVSSAPAATPSAPSVPPEVAAPARPVTVEVWNASGKKGLALDVVRQIRKAGFDVVKWGNYESRQKRTLVRDHRGNAEEARAIAASLSVQGVEIFTRVEASPLVDVEVILGEDYAAAGSSH
jgi:LCP family protein required for cell wall assembly